MLLMEWLPTAWMMLVQWQFFPRFTFRYVNPVLSLSPFLSPILFATSIVMLPHKKNIYIYIYKYIFLTSLGILSGSSVVPLFSSVYLATSLCLLFTFFYTFLLLHSSLGALNFLLFALTLSAIPSPNPPILALTKWSPPSLALTKWSNHLFIIPSPSL